jgi:hypothetical protein
VGFARIAAAVVGNLSLGEDFEERGLAGLRQTDDASFHNFEIQSYLPRDVGERGAISGAVGGTMHHNSEEDEGAEKNGFLEMFRDVVQAVEGDVVGIVVRDESDVAAGMDAVALHARHDDELRGEGEDEHNCSERQAGDEGLSTAFGAEQQQAPNEQQAADNSDAVKASEREGDDLPGKMRGRERGEGDRRLNEREKDEPAEPDGEG